MAETLGSYRRGSRIAIIGAGISGMVAAYLLADDHDLTIFEAGNYIGGHSNTIDIKTAHGVYALDAGFLVCNDRTYPNFLKLMVQLGVALQPSDMSFSVRSEATGLEYNGGTFMGLFAQRTNLLRPAFHRLLWETLRFNREAPKLLDEPGDGPTLSEYLKSRKLAAEFIELYLIPMAAAIWSAKPEQIARFPAKYLVRHFQNHGLLDLFNRPQWYTVSGGAKRYVERLTQPFRDRIRLRCPVLSVRRTPNQVEVQPAQGPMETFDEVIFASHADQTLSILQDADSPERAVLGSFGYQENEAVLHTDTDVLSRNRRCWASWNYHVARTSEDRATVTYNLNQLQNIDSPDTFLVTLNRTAQVRPEKSLRHLRFHHPVYTREAVAAQMRWHEISGVRRTHYCGAYWGFGFHEDGVNSALAVARCFGKTL